MTAKLPYVEIHADFCKGCSLCIENCPPKVIELGNAFNVLGYQFAKYKDQGCTGCEACYYVCPEPGAISLFKEVREKPMTNTNPANQKQGLQK